MYTGIIYIYTNITNQKVYIGQTCRPDIRKAEHKCHSEKRGGNSHFYNAVRKYGWKSFRYEVLEVVVALSEEELHSKLNEAEVFWIKSYNSTDSTKGYNCSEGGQKTGPKSRKVDLCKPNGEIIITFANCKELSEEFGVSENSVRGCLRRNNLFLKRYILTYHGIPKSWERRKSKHIYYQWTLDGILIKEWDSVCDIEKELGFCASTIVKCCLHPEKYKSHKGFKWSREIKTHN